MVLAPTSKANGRIVQADGAVSAETAEQFRTAHDPDRAAMLVAYTLLGAAVNGFVPYLFGAGGIRSARSTRVAVRGIAAYSRSA